MHTVLGVVASCLAVVLQRVATCCEVQGRVLTIGSAVHGVDEVHSALCVVVPCWVAVVLRRVAKCRKVLRAVV